MSTYSANTKSLMTRILSCFVFIYVFLSECVIMCSLFYVCLCLTMKIELIKFSEQMPSIKAAEPLDSESMVCVRCTVCVRFYRPQMKLELESMTQVESLHCLYWDISLASVQFILHAHMHTQRTSPMWHSDRKLRIHDSPHLVDLQYGAECSNASESAI